MMKNETSYFKFPFYNFRGEDGDFLIQRIKTFDICCFLENSGFKTFKVRTFDEYIFMIDKVFKLAIRNSTLCKIFSNMR